ncbi:MAG: hypothetical protein ACYCVD_01825 [Desulfitobacteriaceae bacterium]
MASYRSTQPSNYWVTALKILVLIVALYFSILILGKVFTWVLTFVFAVIKVAVFVAMLFFVIHFLLKLLFGFDLYRLVFGRRFR